MEKWWALQGSNLRHSACKADALPTELSAPIDWVKIPYTPLAQNEAGISWTYPSPSVGIMRKYSAKAKKSMDDR